jgi:signal peptidase I
VVEYAVSFFPALLLVWIVRSFIIQPYRVPTGSLEPTVMPGDFIAVNQFNYGLKYPVVQKTFFQVGKPKVGDIALFYWPENTTIRFVKRVVGIPGDHIVYKNKTLTINGKEMKQEDAGTSMSEEPGHMPVTVTHRIEDLNGIKHDIYVRSNNPYA